MAKQNITGREDEFEALQGIEGVDPSDLLKQAGLEDSDPPGGDPPSGDPPGGDPPSGDPPGGDPPKGDNADLDAQRASFMKEIFGDKFKSVDEVKQLNITSRLEELETLRQEKATLEEQLSKKPKHSWANDDLAKFNEFVKDTGINDYSIFHKLNSSELNTMDPIDVLVLGYRMENPGHSGTDANIRKFFEKKFNVDPDQVDPEELEVNKIGLSTESNKVIKNLTEMKEKIKVPEDSEEPTGPKPLTTEQKEKLTTGWTTIGGKLSESFGKISIPVEGSKDPLINFDLSEDIRKGAIQKAVNFCVENQMEFSEENVRSVAENVYKDLLITNLPKIAHSIFEKARSLTQEEVDKFYENPSPSRNNDLPPGSEGSDDKGSEDTIFEAEMNRG